MGAVDVPLTKTREMVVSMLLPLLNPCHDCSNNGRSRIESREVSLQFLHGQGEGNICPCAFAFDHVPRRLVRVSAARTFRVVLVAPQEFAPAYAAEPCSVFQEPSLFSKRQSSHCIFAGLPVYRRNQSGCQVVLLLPVRLGKRQESVRGDSVFLDCRQLLSFDPKRPFLMA
jgi:hypothetical protein